MGTKNNSMFAYTLNEIQHTGTNCGQIAVSNVDGDTIE